MTKKLQEEKKLDVEEEVADTNEAEEIDESRKKEDLHIEELENQVKRALADYQNLEKRVAEEKRGWIQLANKELLLRLLPVLDTLIQAGKHSEDPSLKVSVAQFLDIVKGEGVEKIETIGKEFDPNIMEVITTAQGEEGKVIDEVRSGYRMYDKILRVAQVIVGKETS